MLTFGKKVPIWVQKQAQIEYKFYHLENWAVEVKWVKPIPPEQSGTVTHAWNFVVHKYNIAIISVSKDLRRSPFSRGIIAHEFRHICYEVFRTAMRAAADLGKRHLSSRQREEMVDRLFEDVVEPVIENDIEARGFPRG